MTFTSETSKERILLRGGLVIKRYCLYLSTNPREFRVIRSEDLSQYALVDANNGVMWCEFMPLEQLAEMLNKRHSATESWGL